jgi:hypothetical protein
MILLRRRLHGRVRLTNHDRWFLIQLYRWFPSILTGLIGSTRRESVDHMVVMGEMHLRWILNSYAHYYNGLRTHRSLNKNAPLSRSVQRTVSFVHAPSLADFITITRPSFRYTQVPLQLLVDGVGATLHAQAPRQRSEFTDFHSGVLRRRFRPGVGRDRAGGPWGRRSR